MDIWLPLLNDDTFYSFVCSILATSVRTPAHRSVVCEWTPPNERAKASKGKRGWEKPIVSSLSIHSPGSADPPLAAHMTASSPITHGAQTSVVGGSHHQGTGFIIRHLLSAIAPGSTNTSQLISLEALAALCKDNPSVDSLFWKLERERTDSYGPSSSPIVLTHSPVESRLPARHHINSSLQSILDLLQSSNPEVRLAAIHLLSNVVKSTTPPPGHLSLNHPFVHPPGSFHSTHGGLAHDNTHGQHYAVSLAIIHALHNIIQGDEESLLIRAKSCFILSRLVKDDDHFAEAATDCGSLQVLFTALEWNLKLPLSEPFNSESGENSIDDDIEEPRQQLYLREVTSFPYILPFVEP